MANPSTADGVGDPRQAALFVAPFDELPPSMRTRAFGVDYAHLSLPAPGGDLYLTRFGWTHGCALLPDHWYADQYYSKHGRRLPDSTGHVYHVHTRPCQGQRVQIVVKFSRVGQEVPLEIATSFPEDVSAQDIAAARFNSPMEEFGLLMELRNTKANKLAGRMLTQKPLAIYVPPQQFDLWRLGRSQSRFHTHQRRLEQDQEQKEAAMGLDIRRDYVMVFQWVNGINAAHAMRTGVISPRLFATLLPRAIEELRAAGFRVLDNKPTHLILRKRRNGKGMVTRNGRPAYALVDFELLQQSEAHHQKFKHAQRERYLQLLSHPSEEKDKPLPPGLQRTNILGVDYLFGATPNGGMLWTVGQDPALFEFFLPDRWRRTPRIRLALTREVCRTRTRDNIHVVYRQSRIGERPHADPFYASGKRIRDYGYNSPFEEVAIAAALRRAGLTTIHPRAIYRTGNQSVKAGYLQDNRRYEYFQDVRTPLPDSEPVLSPRHDYYLIWGLWRGVDPQGTAGFVDLRKAREDGLISPQQHEHLFADLCHRLLAAGFLDTSREDDEYLLLLDRHGQLLRDRRDWFEITFSADALTVFDYGLIDEATYRDLIHRAEAKIRRAGCEPLDLSGNHLLLSLNGDGQLRTDDQGNPLVALCNFELIRMDRCNLDLP